MALSIKDEETDRLVRKRREKFLKMGAFDE